ncbi:MAG: MurR/RpiR family transcriptional regulator [Clostridiales bacterium]|nr:MurR/RpiR family transcriptional regulator [Clostridiales bacterium]
MKTLFTENLRVQIDHLKKAEQSVACYIVNHPDTVIHLSISELAEKSGASMTTIIRLCKKLGLSGYQDMKLVLAKEVSAPLKPLQTDISASDTDAEITTKVFQSAMRALEMSYTALNPDCLSAAAEAIIKARRVVIYGFGNSNSIATDLQHKLLRLGIDAIAYSDLHLQIISTVSLGPQDVLIAISHSGSSKELVAQAKKAKSRGAVVISLTSLGQSPLYKISDIGLSTSSDENEFSVLAFSSRVAQMVLVNTIYAIIAMRKDNAQETLKLLEKELSSQMY